MPIEDRTKRAPEKGPELSPGIAWHLQEDGKWLPEKIPPEILKSSKYTGDLTIQGYKAQVFDTPSGESWAQKADLSEQLGSIASRIAGYDEEFAEEFNNCERPPLK
jgi:hypothetical protein